MSVKLAHQTQKTAGIGNGMRTATIAAVNGSVVTLSVAGGLITSGVGVLESYIPAVGDTVAVFRQDSSWLVLGAIGTSVGPQPRATQTGLESISFAAAISHTDLISFPVPFAAAPAVMTNIDSGAIGRWTTHAINITTTGFTMFEISTDAVALAWSGVAVSWVATARS